MTRTAAREIAVRLCFAMAETGKKPGEILEEFFQEEYYATLASEDEAFVAFPDEGQMNYITRLLNGVGQHQAELDGYIAKYAKGWEFARISRTALAVMRIAMYELLYMQDIPDKAAINEAVELAKAYEEPETVPFVNGVLGGFYRSEVLQP